MLNSILLMFSQYNKNRICATIFKIFWVLYIVILNFNFSFRVANLLAFMCTSVIINIVDKLFPKLNIFLSVFSIIIYSFFMDIICYYTVKNDLIEHTLIQYILNGFLFNYKYIILNIVIVCIINFRGILMKARRIILPMQYNGLGFLLSKFVSRGI